MTREKEILMKVKTRLFVLLAALVVLAFAVMPVFAQGTGPAEPPASSLAVPIELQALIAMGIGYIVTQGLKSLSKLLGFDLGGWGAALTASIVTTVILFLNALLSAIPATAQPSVAIGLTLLVSILGAFGVHSVVKSFQPVQPK
jgi:hypothetical protein